MSGLSLYQLHRCMYDHLRAGEVGSGTAPAFDLSRYELTDEERASFESKDIAGLYRMGLHPVLLNSYCRAAGFSRNDYRGILEAQVKPETRTARWHK